MRVAYADPPYPGRARRCYRDQPDFAGEVDHAELIAELEAGGYDGWALSTAADALRELLPLCPPEVWVLPWVKPLEPSVRTRGLHNCWEALLVVGGRQERPGRRDWFSAAPARGGGQLPGRKPLAFCVALFEALGMRPGDELVDMFPGTGIVSRAWAELSAGAAAGSDGSALRGVASRRRDPDDRSGQGAADVSRGPNEILSDGSPGLSDTWVRGSRAVYGRLERAGARGR